MSLVDTRTSHNLLTSIVEHTDTLIMAVATDFTILAANKANLDEFERIYGIRPRVGDNMLALLADQPEHEAEVRAGWSRGLQGEEVTFAEAYGVRELSRPHYEIKFRPLHDENGTLIGCYQFVTDITQRLRDQALLAETQEALRQAQKFEAIGQLTGGVAHDFNNLLTVIKSSTELLKRPGLPDERRSRYVKAIAEAVDQAAKLTSQLLAFARRQALKPEVLDAKETVRAISKVLGTLTESQIEVVVEFSEAPCHLHVDPGQFNTAIVNMAVNARDAMQGEGQLTIALEVVDQMPATPGQASVSGAFVALSIADNGCGIADEHLGKIFDPFFTTKGVGKGTGLGLSQVFGFSRQSGGAVTVETKVGKGSVFTLYLPRAETPVQTPAVREETESLEEDHGTCVLVVEDNPNVGSFTVTTLTDLGYVTVWAASAEQALAELDKDANRFDVVFSDVVMPGMNGIDLAHEIRRRHPDLPVLLASGYSHVLAQSGTNGFELLHKPYSVEQLSQLLRRVAAAGRNKSPAPFG